MEIRNAPMIQKRRDQEFRHRQRSIAGLGLQSLQLSSPETVSNPDSHAQEIDVGPQKSEQFPGSISCQCEGDEHRPTNAIGGGENLSAVSPKREARPLNSS